jgi:hypothetical protein
LELDLLGNKLCANFDEAQNSHKDVDTPLLWALEMGKLICGCPQRPKEKGWNGWQGATSVDINQVNGECMVSQTDASSGIGTMTTPAKPHGFEAHIQQFKSGVFM